MVGGQLGKTHNHFGCLQLCARYFNSSLCGLEVAAFIVDLSSDWLSGETGAARGGIQFLS